MAIEILRDCERCNGTGEVIRTPMGGIPGLVPCSDCEGTSKMHFLESSDLETVLGNLETKLDNLQETSDDILDKVNDIKEKCDDIKEKCDEIWDKVK